MSQSFDSIPVGGGNTEKNPVCSLCCRSSRSVLWG